MRYLLQLCMLTMPCFVLYGQAVYEINNADSKAWIDGTSTLKNWSAHVKKMSGTFEVDSSGEILAINLSFDATSIYSDRSADMDAKIHKALKTSAYPNITYKGGSAPASPEFDMGSSGVLSIIGKDQKLTLMTKGTLDTRITGSTKIKFSTFEIDPPSALFGTIVCKDDLTFNFDLSFTKSMK